MHTRFKPALAACVHNTTGASEDEDDDVLRAFQSRAPALRVGVRVFSVGCPGVPGEGTKAVFCSSTHTNVTKFAVQQRWGTLET